jgi:hypothetical protein
MVSLIDVSGSWMGVPLISKLRNRQFARKLLLVIAKRRVGDVQVERLFDNVRLGWVGWKSALGAMVPWYMTRPDQ